MREGWRHTSLGLIAQVVGGGTPKTNVGAYWGGAIPWITPTEVVRNAGKVIAQTDRRLTEAGLAASSAQLLPAKTVLMTSRATVGEVALAGTPMATNQGFAAFICDPDVVMPEFLLYWIQLNRNEFINRASGSTFLEVSRRNVKTVPIDLPPPHEQRRIVTLLSSFDRALVAADVVAQSSARLVDSLIVKLLEDTTGEATPLGKVALEARDRTDRLKNSGVSRYVAMEHMTTANPTIEQYGDPGTSMSTKTLFQEGDVLFGKLRPYLRKVAKAPWPGMASTEILVIRPKDKEVVTADYLLTFLRSWPVLRAAVDSSAGTRMPRTSFKSLAQLMVPLPLVAEQTRITKVVGSVDTMAKEARCVVATTTQLRSAVLADLLSGTHDWSSNTLGVSFS